MGPNCFDRHERKDRRELPQFVTDAYLEMIIAENVNLIPVLEVEIPKPGASGGVVVPKAVPVANAAANPNVHLLS